VETAHGEFSELLERRRAEVEVRRLAAGAAVGDGDSDRLALVRGSDLLVADGVVVRVAASVARVVVIKVLRHRYNVIRIGVGDTAGTKAGLVVGSVASLSAGQPGRLVGRHSRGGGGGVGVRAASGVDGTRDAHRQCGHSKGESNDSVDEEHDERQKGVSGGAKEWEVSRDERTEEPEDPAEK